MAGAPFGFGMVLVFLSIMNYLVSRRRSKHGLELASWLCCHYLTQTNSRYQIDAYVIFAASVLAANAVLRSLFGAAFPLFTR